MAFTQRHIELLTEFAQTTPALATNMELLTEFRSEPFRIARLYPTKVKAHFRFVKWQVVPDLLVRLLSVSGYEIVATNMGRRVQIGGRACILACGIRRKSSSNT